MSIIDCQYVYYIHMLLVIQGSRREQWISWNLSYRWSQATMQLWEMETWVVFKSNKFS